MSFCYYVLYILSAIPVHMYVKYFRHMRAAAAKVNSNIYTAICMHIFSSFDPVVTNI